MTRDEITPEREALLRRTYAHPRLMEASSCAWCHALLYPEKREPHADDCIAANVRALLADRDALAAELVRLRGQLERVTDDTILAPQDGPG